MRTLLGLLASLLIALAWLVLPSGTAGAARVAIYDDPGAHVLRDSTDCVELVYGGNGTGSGSYYPVGPPYHNVWLSPPNGAMAASSDSVTTVICIQYHSSDGNDGISEIYIDGSPDPLVRVDTYRRGVWYVEVSQLTAGPHSVMVLASGDSSPLGVVPSPHRTSPATGDNDVWYFCFSNATTPVSEGSPDPGHCSATWGELAEDGETPLVCPGGDGSVIGVLIRDKHNEPIGDALVTAEILPDCGACRCETVTARTESLAGFAAIPVSMGLDRSMNTSCCEVSVSVRCEMVTIAWSGTGGALADARPWVSPDLNGDCYVDMSDFFMLNGDMGTTACRTDFNCSGLVDTADSRIFTAHFAQTCEPWAGIPGQPGPESGSTMLKQNSPNPFGSLTRLVFEAPSPGRAVLTVYSASGRAVRTIALDCDRAGTHEAVWDGRDERGSPVGSGVYFCRLEMAGRLETGRMVLIR